MTFASDVDAIVKHALADVDSVFKNVAHDVAMRVINQTPVDIDMKVVKGKIIPGGTTKNSWYSGVNKKPTGRGRRHANGTGMQAIAQAEAAIASLKVGDTFRMVNRKPYIEVLEFGGYPKAPKKGKGKTVNGYSTQAPQGIARISLIRAKTRLRRYANIVRAKSRGAK